MWAEIGFLVQFESLLSTRGKELAMLGDFDVAVRALRNFRFRIVSVTADTIGGTFSCGIQECFAARVGSHSFVFPREFVLCGL